MNNREMKSKQFHPYVSRRENNGKISILINYMTFDENSEFYNNEIKKLRESLDSEPDKYIVNIESRNLLKITDEVYPYINSLFINVGHNAMVFANKPWKNLKIFTLIGDQKVCIAKLETRVNKIYLGIMRSDLQTKVFHFFYCLVHSLQQKKPENVKLVVESAHSVEQIELNPDISPIITHLHRRVERDSLYQMRWISLQSFFIDEDFSPSETAIKNMERFLSDSPDVKAIVFSKPVDKIHEIYGRFKNLEIEVCGFQSFNDDIDDALENYRYWKGTGTKKVRYIIEIPDINENDPMFDSNKSKIQNALEFGFLHETELNLSMEQIQEIADDSTIRVSKNDSFSFEIRYPEVDWSEIKTPTSWVNVKFRMDYFSKGFLHLLKNSPNLVKIELDSSDVHDRNMYQMVEIFLDDLKNRKVKYPNFEKLSVDGDSIEYPIPDEFKGYFDL